MPVGGHRVLNAFVLHVSMPALVLVKMHALLRGEGLVHSAAEMILPASMAWVQFGLAIVFGWLVSRALHLNRATTGAWILMTGLGNTSFVGFPILDSLYGPPGVEVGVLVDQPGTFLVFATLGLITAGYFSGREGSLARHLSQTLRKTLSFPPTIAMILSVILVPVSFSPSWIRTLDAVSASLIPAALVSVGAQLSWDRAALRRCVPALASGLGFKLILSPVMMTLLYAVILGQKSFASQITIVESAMAPMISAAILVEDAELDSELAGLMLGLGILLSFVTVPLWAQKVIPLFW